MKFFLINILNYIKIIIKKSNLYIFLLYKYKRYKYFKQVWVVQEQRKKKLKKNLLLNTGFEKAIAFFLKKKELKA